MPRGRNLPLHIRIRDIRPLVLRKPKCDLDLLRRAVPPLCNIYNKFEINRIHNSHPGFSQSHIRLSRAPTYACANMNTNIPLSPMSQN